MLWTYVKAADEHVWLHVIVCSCGQTRIIRQVRGTEFGVQVTLSLTMAQRQN